MLSSVLGFIVENLVLCEDVLWPSSVDSIYVVGWTVVLEVLMVELTSSVVPIVECLVDWSTVEIPTEVLTDVLVALMVVDVGVAKVEVKVLCSVVTCTVGTVVLFAVLSATVDSASVVVAEDD